MTSFFKSTGIVLFIAFIGGAPAIAQTNNIYDDLRDLTGRLTNMAVSASAFSSSEPPFSPEISASLLSNDRETKAEAAKFKLTGAASEKEVIDLASKASIVFVADLHGKDAIQKRAGEIFELLSDATSRKKVFIAEFIFSDYQGLLDQFMEGKLTTDQLRDQIHFETVFGPDRWDPYAKLLEMLRERKATVLAAFLGNENSDWADLPPRDNFVIKIVKDSLKEDPNALVYLLHGQNHIVGRNHLADRLDQAFPNKTVTLVTAVSQVNWQVLERKLNLDPKSFFAIEGGNKNSFYFSTVTPVDFDLYALTHIWYFVDPAHQGEATAKIQAVTDAYSKVVTEVESGEVQKACVSLKAFMLSLNDWQKLMLSPGVILKPETLEGIKPAIINAGAFKSGCSSTIETL